MIGGPNARVNSGPAATRLTMPLAWVPPPLAASGIGGGTDAQGNVNLVAAGPLFTLAFGPPINYHGLGEGAPIEDLRLSARILYQIMLGEVANKTTK